MLPLAYNVAPAGHRPKREVIYFFPLHLVLFVAHSSSLLREQMSPTN